VVESGPRSVLTFVDPARLDGRRVTQRVTQRLTAVVVT